MSIEIVSEVTLLPTGMEPGDDNEPSFEVKVVYQGPYEGKRGGGYAVTHRGRQLARVARTWTYVARRDFRRWQYRWPDLESALEAAREEVDLVRFNGRTWAEWASLWGGAE